MVVMGFRNSSESWPSRCAWHDSRQISGCKSSALMSCAEIGTGPKGSLLGLALANEQSSPKASPGCICIALAKRHLAFRS